MFRYSKLTGLIPYDGSTSNKISLIALLPGEIGNSITSWDNYNQNNLDNGKGLRLLTELLMCSINGVQHNPYKNLIGKGGIWFQNQKQSMYVPTHAGIKGIKAKEGTSEYKITLISENSGISGNFVHITEPNNIKNKLLTKNYLDNGKGFNEYVPKVRDIGKNNNTFYSNNINVDVYNHPFTISHDVDKLLSLENKLAIKLVNTIDISKNETKSHAPFIKFTPQIGHHSIELKSGPYINRLTRAFALKLLTQ